MAPAAGGAPVQFNVAAHAANDDAPPLGDSVYVLVRQIEAIRSRR